MTRPAFRVLLALCLLIVPASVLHADDVSWRVLRTRHFIIHHAAHQRAVAENAGRIGERWHVMLSKKLNFTPRATIPMYLYPDRRTFADATGYKPDESVVGTAQTRSLRIKVDASMAFTRIERIIPHELVHVFISWRLTRYTDRMPLWMHEGLAKHLSGDRSAGDIETLQDAVSSGGLIPLSKLESTFPSDRTGRAIAYAESLSVVSYLVEKYKEDSIPDILTELADGRPFPIALEYSIATSPEKLEKDWTQYIWDKYGWDRWIRLTWGLISAGMALLAILAFRRRLRRKYRKVEEYEEQEEEEESDTLDYGPSPEK